MVWPGGFLDFEERLAGCGLGFVAGVDEAGRGPLAGPVVASAVILKHGRLPDGLGDSKTIPPSRRLRVFEEIRRQAVSIGVGIVPPEMIDRLNILQATLLAMGRAISSLDIRPDCVIVDGTALPQLEMPAVCMAKGDVWCASVAAASVVAKVTRDGIMEAMDMVYPRYSFKFNKGYGTKDHIEALRLYGPTNIHRFSFEPVLSAVKQWGVM